MKQLTNYRKKYDDYGIIEYLQYEKEIPFLFFWKRKVWRYIWKPYWSEWRGRDTPLNTDLFVSAISHSLDGFVDKYPYIEDWYTEASIEQEKLEAEAAESWRKRNEKKNKTTYL